MEGGLLRGACPEHHKILRYAQNDPTRRARNDTKEMLGFTPLLGVKPTLYAFTQVTNVDGGKGSRRAASGNDMLSSVTISTASSRNSFVYLPCGIPFILTPPPLYFS